MREIKFRAWYKDDIALGKPLLFEQRLIDGDELFFVCVSDEEIKYRFDIPFMDDDWIVEQFIGITSADGVDIYEGDIVSVDTEPQLGNSIITYRDDCGAFYLHGKDDVILVGEIRVDSKIQIVGNIHVNPELVTPTIE